ncbi:MAG: TIR domain-containing protein [Acidobacteria bacterium]|nr:TIR domain-containing protein [Acidobacteriota bacterium]
MTPNSQALARTKVFISYSHKDYRYLERILVHLGALELKGIEAWSDKNIESGARWEEEITAAIASARVALLLISADFCASRFIQQKEVPLLLTKAENEGSKIISLIVKPLVALPPYLARLQAFNSIEDPLADMSPTMREKKYVELAREIQRLVDSQEENPEAAQKEGNEKEDEEEPGAIFIPPLRAHPFVDRTDELPEIVNHLKQPGCLIYLYGPPGTGKTALANEAVWHLREHFRDRIIYDDCYERTYDDVLNLIARFFGCPALANLPTKTRQNEVLRLLNEHKPVLVVLDGIDGKMWIRNLNAIASVASVLVTSRQIEPRGRKLPLLDPESSIQLFENTYDEPIAPEHKSCVSEIVRLLGYMPLAIELCAHRARVSKRSLKSLSDELKKRKILLNLSNMSRDIREVINLSYGGLKPKTKMYFNMLSLFEGNSFSRECVTRLWDSDEGLEHLDRLIDLSLVMVSGADRYSLHPVMQAFAKEEFERSNPPGIFLDRLVSYFVQFAETNRTNFNILETERENLLAVLAKCRESRSQDYLTIASSLLRRTSTHFAYGFLPQRGYWKEALSIVSTAIQLTADPGEKSKFYAYKGLLLYWLGEHEKSMEAYEQGIALCGGCEDYYCQAMILQWQGFIRSDEGYYRECEALYRKSLQISEQHQLPKEMLWTAKQLVGVVLYHQCRYEESRSILEEIFAKKNELARGFISVTERRLAGLYRRTGLFPQAERLLNSCLRYERSVGNERNIARGLRQLGMLKLATHSLEEAETALEEGYRIFVRLGNKQGISAVLANMGDLSIRKNQLQKAKSQLLQSLSLAKSLRSPYGIGMALWLLAEISSRKGRHARSASLSRLALNMLERIGYAHVENLIQLHNRSIRSLGMKSRRRIARLDAYDGNCTNATKVKFDEIRQKARPHLQENDPEIDPNLLDLTNDTRRGISLVIRPSEDVKSLLGEVQARLRKIAPSQHHYLPGDLHTTVLSLITAKEEFHLDYKFVTCCIESLSVTFQNQQPFRIHYHGLSSTRDCILVNGYYRDGTLDQIREEARKQAIIQGLTDKMEQRLWNESAHLTCVRFCCRDHALELSQEVDKCRELELGISPVTEIQLVLNDWYMSIDKVHVLHTFHLGRDLNPAH